MDNDRTVGLRPTPRKLFEKSFIKNFKGNALRAFPGVLLVLVVMLGLSGCQLAREGAEHEEARMVGVFITSEHVDLFSDIEVSQPIPMRWGRPDFSALFQPRRLYARWDEEVGEFRFPDLEGIPFFHATRLIPLGDGAYNDVIINHSGPGIVSQGAHHAFGNNSVSVEMEATVYVVPGAQVAAQVHMNPVYQTACGRVFLQTGHAFSSHRNQTEGRLFSSSFSESTTVTQNGVETVNSTSVTINISAMFAPVKITLLEMDEDSQVVGRGEFAPGAVPHRFYPSESTAYIIVETHRDRPYAHERVVRELVARNVHWHSQWVSTFAARDDGILEAHSTEIVWGGR